jgi:hypothetical protein
MNCIDIEKLLNAYIDNELDSKTSKVVEEHIKVCKKCISKLLFLQNVTSILESYPIYESIAHEKVKEKVISYFRKKNYIRNFVKLLFQKRVKTVPGFGLIFALSLFILIDVYYSHALTNEFVILKTKEILFTMKKEIENYKKINNKYPKKIRKIKDACGYEIIYKVDESTNSYQLYSVGLNGKDDNGLKDDINIKDIMVFELSETASLYFTSMVFASLTIFLIGGAFVWIILVYVRQIALERI